MAPRVFADEIMSIEVVSGCYVGELMVEREGCVHLMHAFVIRNAQVDPVLAGFLVGAGQRIVSLSKFAGGPSTTTVRLPLPKRLLRPRRCSDVVVARSRGIACTDA